MRHEFWANYAFIQADDTAQRQALDYLLGAANVPNQLQHLAAVSNPVARIDLLTQALQTSLRDYARVGSRRQPGGLRQLYGSGQFDVYLGTLKQTFLEPLGLWPALPDLTALPRYSFALHFAFTLRQPYLSKDDTAFYVIDNPVKKEWVFKVPYVAPSQWKGALRAALTSRLVDESRTSDEAWVEGRLQLTRLFGNEKGVGLDDKQFEAYLDERRPVAAVTYRRRLQAEYTDTSFLAGRLHFYPTYFGRIDLEVINPHDRETGAGQQPIYFEAVPQGSPGTFTLLYVPFDRIGEDEKHTSEQVAADLPLVVEGIKAMITDYGFGAKTSSGFGLVEDGIQGEWILKAPTVGDTPPQPVTRDTFKSFQDMMDKIRARRETML